MATNLFCWQCGGRLEERNGKVLFREVTLPGGNVVKCHIICSKDVTVGQRAEVIELGGFRKYKE